MLYKIWEEGFEITGDYSDAHYIGSVNAETFQEACDILCRGNPDYNSKTRSIWGCRLYDNETDARRAFG